MGCLRASAALGAAIGTGRFVGGLGTMGGSLDGVGYLAQDGQKAPKAAYSVPVLTVDHLLREREAELGRARVFLKVDV